MTSIPFSGVSLAKSVRGITGSMPTTVARRRSVMGASGCNTLPFGLLLFSCPVSTGSPATTVTACLIDEVLSATGKKSGYSFLAPGVAPIPRVSYTATGTPTLVGSSGQRSFFTDQSGVIRYDTTGAPATAGSPAL